MRPVVFIDGECVLCSRLAAWLERNDRAGRFRIAALQGESAREMLGPRETEPSEWVVVLLDDDGVHERTEAVLRLVEGLGGVWRLVARSTRLVPRVVRDCLYDVVARRRYRWFGRESECRLFGRGGDDRFLP